LAASARIVTISKTIGVIGKEHQGAAQVQNVTMAGVTLNNLKIFSLWRQRMIIKRVRLSVISNS
jgi:hypothetical protein